MEKRQAAGLQRGEGRAAHAAAADAAERLRRIGQRVTPQRLAVLAALEPGAHLTAEAVCARIEAAAPYPAITRSTVYRTLEAFRDLGLVSETDLGGGARQFELMAECRHHHLVCRGCAAVLDLDDALIHPLHAAIAERYGFAVEIDHLALFGWCAACRAKDV